MKYKKRPKRKYITYWKETAGFDCEKELQIYKFLCGRRMLHNPEVKYCFTRKEDWEKYVYDQYADRSVEQLRNFLIYLEQGKRDAKEEQQITISYMLPIFVALMAGSFFPYFIGWLEQLNTIKLVVEFVAATMGLTLFLFGLLGMIYNGIKPVWDNTDKKYFYKDYMEIIARIIQHKMGAN